MAKLLMMSDLHLCARGARIVGLDPAARFAEALDHALAHHGDAEALLLLGDLTHRGLAAEYGVLAELLERVPMPVHATLGNHDDPAVFAAAMPDLAAGPFQQMALARNGLRILILDTVDREGRAPHHGGWICEARLQWLDAELAKAAGEPLLVACHHPPFATGFEGMDAINLANGAVLLDRLAAHAGPVQLVCGHVHRWISGAVRGMGFSVLKSPCHQMPLVLGPAATTLSSTEPGGYALVLTTPHGAIIHQVELGPEASRAHDAQSG